MAEQQVVDLTRDSFLNISSEKEFDTNHECFEGSHECNYLGCQNKYKRNYNLLIHMRTHTGEKPYECNQCPKSFNEKGNLKTHMRTHTGERPYKCEFMGCELSFKTSGQLKEHSKTHSHQRPFKCFLCKGSFARKSTLLTHMKSSSHRDLLTKINECECKTKPLVKVSNPELRIQSYSFSITPENEPNSLECLCMTFPTNDDYLIALCECEDLQNRKSHNSLRYLNDLTCSMDSSVDDYCMFNFEKDLEL